MNDSIPILMYHQLSPSPRPAFRKYTVTPRAFAMQMAWLALARYTPVHLDTLVEYYDGRGPLPARPIVITFDDGFKDCVKYAIPILKARGFTAIFYVVAGLVGKTSRWLRAERGIELELMDWSTARRLLEAGFQIGAHSMTHPHLAEIPIAECRRELLEARKLLESYLGQPVPHLAYPFGSFNERVAELAAEAGYRSACTVRMGRATSHDSLLALPRIPVTGQDSLLDFILRLRSAQNLPGLISSEAPFRARRTPRPAVPSATLRGSSTLRRLEERQGGRRSRRLKSLVSRVTFVDRIFGRGHDG